jgi:hypothetical protein
LLTHDTWFKFIKLINMLCVTWKCVNIYKRFIAMLTVLKIIRFWFVFIIIIIIDEIAILCLILYVCHCDYILLRKLCWHQIGIRISFNWFQFNLVAIHEIHYNPIRIQFLKLKYIQHFYLLIEKIFSTKIKLFKGNKIVNKIKGIFLIKLNK